MPDMYVLGKALGGGIVPVSAVAADRDVLGVLKPGEHGSTFGGNPLACAVGIAVVELLRTGEFQRRSAELGAHLHEGLNALIGQGVVAVRGRGLWAGVDIDPALMTGRQACERLAARGVLAKDTHGSTIRLAPPLVVTEEDLDHARGPARRDPGRVRPVADRLRGAAASAFELADGHRRRLGHDRLRLADAAGGPHAATGPRSPARRARPRRRRPATRVSSRASVIRSSSSVEPPGRMPVPLVLTSCTVSAAARAQREPDVPAADPLPGVLGQPLAEHDAAALGRPADHDRGLGRDHETLADHAVDAYRQDLDRRARRRRP